MTDAEFLHRQSLERERANRANTKPDLKVGKVWVEENVQTRIGALCFVRPPKRQDHHERAAERFKTNYEALFGSGVPALDNSRPVVDRSPIAHDSGMAQKLDRGADMIVLIGTRPGVRPILSKASTDRLVACLVLCIPCGEGLHWRAREKAIDLLLDDLDRLSVYWHLKSRAA